MYAYDSAIFVFIFNLYYSCQFKVSYSTHHINKGMTDKWKMFIWNDI